MKKEQDLRRIILRDEYVEDLSRAYLVTYDANLIDIVKIEKIVAKVRRRGDYMIEDILEKLCDKKGIVDIDNLSYYEIYI